MTSSVPLTWSPIRWKFLQSLLLKGIIKTVPYLQGNINQGKDEEPYWLHFESRSLCAILLNISFHLLKESAVLKSFSWNLSFTNPWPWLVLWLPLHSLALPMPPQSFFLITWWPQDVFWEFSAFSLLPHCLFSVNMLCNYSGFHSLKWVQEMDLGLLSLAKFRRLLLASSWVYPNKNQACFKLGLNCAGVLLLTGGINSC